MTLVNATIRVNIALSSSSLRGIFWAESSEGTGSGLVGLSDREYPSLIILSSVYSVLFLHFFSGKESYRSFAKGT